MENKTRDGNQNSNPDSFYISQIQYLDIIILCLSRYQIFKKN